MKYTRRPLHRARLADQQTIHACLDNMEVTIACSRVCSYWRRVALSLPSIWTDIFLNHATAQTFSMRSASSLLGLVVFAGCKGVTQSLEWLPHVVDRVGSLSIILGHLHTINNVLSAFDSFTTYPNLTRLDIEYCQPFVEGTVLPAVAVRMPNLRCLHLNQVSIDIIPFTDLTELSLVATFFDEIHRFQCSADELLALIRRSPRLETLILDEILLTPPVNSSSSITELPRLRSLCLRAIFGWITASQWFLERIHVPSWKSTGIAPRFSNNAPTQSKWQMMALHIDARIYRLYFGPMIGHLEDATICVDGDPSSNWTAIPSLVMTFGVTPMPSLTIIVDGRPSFHPSNDTPADVGTWTALLARTPSLQVLHIVAPRVWADNILSALCPEAAGLTGYPCPKLECLSILVHTSESRAYGRSVDGKEFGSRVVTLMERRRVHGYSLVDLAMNFGTRHSLATLREYTECVHLVGDPEAPQLRYRDVQSHD